MPGVGALIALILLGALAVVVVYRVEVDSLITKLISRLKPQKRG